MKFIKFLFKAILVIVVLVVVALLALPLWFGPVAKGIANVAVPKVVMTDFNLAHLSLNPYTARFGLGGLMLANPEGYSEKLAAKVGELNFDAETLSLATDVIHVEEITVKDVFVSYIDGGANKVNNFLQIQYNVAGGKEKYEEAQAAKKAEEAAKPEPPKAEEPAEEKPAKKIIIDKLTISGLKIQLGLVPISIPFDIKLTDIGRKSGGATFAEAGQEIWSGITKAAGSAFGAASDAVKSVGNALNDTVKATKALKDVKGDATKVNEAVKAVGDNAGKALDSIKKLW